MLILGTLKIEMHSWGYPLNVSCLSYECVVRPYLRAEG